MGIKYHLGCGTKYLDGYVNVDFPQSEHSIVKIRADMYSNLLQMKYESCEEIRSHHVFEHFNYIESLVLLVKWTQALQIGGILRIDIPDIDVLCRELANSIDRRDIRKIFKIVRLLYGSHEAEWAYHINGWTAESLSHTLEKFGYSVLSSNKYGNSSSPFPNCGLDMKFLKNKAVPDISEKAKEMLSYYSEPCETGLLEEYRRVFEKLAKE